jgi:hypothetical protein
MVSVGQGEGEEERRKGDRMMTTLRSLSFLSLSSLLSPPILCAKHRVKQPATLRVSSRGEEKKDTE